MPAKPALKAPSTTQLSGTAKIPSKASLLCCLTIPWSVHMYMSYTGSSQETVSEWHAGRDAASVGGCERSLEGQEAACQEGGCSPASSCLQVCSIHNFGTLGNSEWTSQTYTVCAVLCSVCCRFAPYLLSTLPDHAASKVTAAELFDLYESLIDHDFIMWGAFVRYLQQHWMSFCQSYSTEHHLRLQQSN